MPQLTDLEYRDVKEVQTNLSYSPFPDP